MKKYTLLALICLTAFLALVPRSKANRLKKGVKYIRIAPATLKSGLKDYSYHESSLIFDGYDILGKLRFHSNILGTITLSEAFNDNNWIPLRDITKMPKTSLNNLRGKWIQRTRPTPMGNGYTSISYTQRPVVLLVATKYHLIVYDPEFSECTILDSRYANPDDWVEVCQTARGVSWRRSAIYRL